MCRRLLPYGPFGIIIIIIVFVFKLVFSYFVLFLSGFKSGISFISSSKRCSKALREAIELTSSAGFAVEIISEIILNLRIALAFLLFKV
jgi:hypothetical protein